MQVLVWSGLFLAVTVWGSLVELISMIGLPIAPDVHAGVAALAVLVLVSGIGLILLPPGGSQPSETALAPRI